MSEVVLVTGGSGFIGTWVLRDLLANDVAAVAFDLAPNPKRWQRILGPHASKIEFASGSLLDRERLHRLCLDRHVTHLIHLAALLTPACQLDPFAGCEVNLLGSVSLFETARRLGKQIRGFSYASSIGQFGPEPDDRDASATEAGNQPPNFYGAYKKALEMLAEQYWRHFRIASLGVRPHVVYGPERDQGLTASPSQAAKAVARGEPFTIDYTGSAGYDYVEDVARAFVRGALETPPGANACDLPNTPATTQDIVAFLETLVPGARVVVNGPPIPHNVAPSRPISVLYPDWRATTLEEGLRKTVAFYRNETSAREPSAP